MGCTSYDPLNYEENQKEDYLTKTIFESIMARKRAKIQGEFDAERKEQEDREKELLRQQYLLDSINPRGPKSYVDNLINKEIPKMEFGNLASEEQILDDLNNRECEAYDADEKVEETEEQMTEGEIKEKQEKNRNEMEEIKRKLEELNKKSEEEKGKKSKKKKGEKDGFFGNKKENKEENKSKSKTENEEEKENDENEQSKKEKSELNEEEENENESKIKSNKDKKDKNNKKNKDNKNIEEINDNIYNINENEEMEDNEEEDEENSNNKKIKNKMNIKNRSEKSKKNEINSKNSQSRHEMETEEEKEISNFKSEDLESNEKEKEKQLLREKMLEERKLNRQKKMKELMKLKAENLPYADKIKKYKYPKKEIQEKPEIDFSPTPAEIILCVIGEEKNGKSSFIKKYTRNVFEQTYKKTEEIDTYDNIEVEYENKKIKLNIIDTPPLNKRKYTNLIQENINKSHIIFYVIDINDEYADFKVKLTMQNFEFNEKQIIAILGNKSDKVSIFAKKNKDTFEGYCSLRKYIFEIISCQDKPKNELENFMNNKVIKEYFYLYGK